jgi:hypothetical protein
MPLFGIPIQNSIFNTSLASIYINVSKAATVLTGDASAFEIFI